MPTISIWSVLSTLLIGGAGWLIAEFFGRQIIRFHELRRLVHEEITYTANAMALGGAADERFIKATDDLRRLAAQLQAFAIGASYPTDLYLKRFGYDPKAAGEALIGYSNSLGNYDGSRSIARHKVQRGLRLPLEYSETEIKEIWATLLKRSARRE